MALDGNRNRVFRRHDGRRGIIASWGGFKNKVYTMAIASFVMAVSTFALGIVPVFWVYLAIMAVLE